MMNQHKKHNIPFWWKNTETYHFWAPQRSLVTLLRRRQGPQHPRGDRRRFVTRRDLVKNGNTDECQACTQLATGMHNAKAPHDDRCRDRIGELMAEDDDPETRRASFVTSSSRGGNPRSRDQLRCVPTKLTGWKMAQGMRQRQNRCRRRRCP